MHMLIGNKGRMQWWRQCGGSMTEFYFGEIKLSLLSHCSASNTTYLFIPKWLSVYLTLNLLG